MSTNICPSHNEYNEPLHWTFTAPLGTCVYNIFDEISFIVGWLSVCAWTFALLPQIITNCKNKAAESQSFWFWLLWLVGDCCNFTGCILTKNLVTNIALAFVYFSFTAFACLQFLWYEYLIKKWRFNKKKLHPQHHHKHHHHHNDKQKHKKIDETTPILNTHNIPIHATNSIYSTPQFAQKFVQNNNKMIISPQLMTTLEILNRSPRVFAYSHELNRGMRREYNSMRAQRQMIKNDEYSVSSSSSSSSSSSESNKSNKSNKSTVYNSSTPRQSQQSATTSNISNIKTSIANNPSYGSVSNIMSTLSSMSITVVTLYGINNNNNSNTNHGQRQLLSSNSPSHSEDMWVMFGIIMGWMSSVIYISSRIPQLRLMMKTKNVSGLNPLFFLLTFSGNITQCLSMLINKQIYDYSIDLVSKLPWLISSGVCLFQDAFIVILIWIYSNDKFNQNGDDIGIDKQGVMMPSPHYLVMNASNTTYSKNKMKKNTEKRNKKQKQSLKIYNDNTNININTDYYYEYEYGDNNDKDIDRKRVKFTNIKNNILTNTI